MLMIMYCRCQTQVIMQQGHSLLIIPVPILWIQVQIYQISARFLHFHNRPTNTLMDYSAIA